MSNLRKIDGIILDIDGTIWNTTEIVAQAWNNAIKDSGHDFDKITAETLQHEFGRTMDVIASDLWPQLSKSEQDNLINICCKYEHEAVSQNERDITYPDVVNTIKDLSKTVDFYVVSNCQSGYIELMLLKTGLKEYVKDFTCFGDTRQGKAYNINLIVKRNNLKSSIYVGDTQGDADACREAGVPFVWASYGFGTVKEYYGKIDNFSNIKTYLDKD